MTVTNDLHLPQAFVDAVGVERHNKPGCYSATTLNKGVKEVVLMERHWEEFTVDASDSVWAVWGTAVHKIFEDNDASHIIKVINSIIHSEEWSKSEKSVFQKLINVIRNRYTKEDSFTEESFEIPVSNSKVTGKVDLYNMKHGLIEDWKTASVYKVMKADFSDWYKQGMTYAWLLTQNGFPVRRCRFIAMLKDFSFTKADTESGYPKKPVYVYEFEVTPEELKQTGERILKKVLELEAAEKLTDDEIPQCLPEERWADPPKYAVMKEGRKSAVRVFEDENMANTCLKQLGEKHYLEERPAVSRKCEKYCICNEFCNFYKQEIKE